MRQILRPSGERPRCLRPSPGTSRHSPRMRPFSMRLWKWDSSEFASSIWICSTPTSQWKSKTRGITDASALPSGLVAQRAPNDPDAPGSSVGGNPGSDRGPENVGRRLSQSSKSTFRHRPCGSRDHNKPACGPSDGHRAPSRREHPRMGRVRFLDGTVGRGSYPHRTGRGAQSPRHESHRARTDGGPRSPEEPLNSPSYLSWVPHVLTVRTSAPYSGFAMRPCR